MANNKDIPYLTSPDKSFIASPLSDEQIAAQKIAKAYRQHERKTFDDVAFDSMQKATPELSIAEADKTRADLLGYKADKSTADVHKALMAAGMTPGLGNIADLVDATLYALEGEFGEAGLSLAAIAPMAGQMVTAKRALKAAKEAGEEVVTIYRTTAWHPKKGVSEYRGMVGEKFSPSEFKEYAKEMKDYIDVSVFKPKVYSTGESMIKKGRFIGGDFSRLNPITNKYNLPEGTIWGSTTKQGAMKWSTPSSIDVGIVGSGRRVGSTAGKGSYLMTFEIPKKELGKLNPIIHKGTNVGIPKGMPKKWLKKVSEITDESLRMIKDLETGKVGPYWEMMENF